MALVIPNLQKELLSPWHESNDHRSIFFVNRSSEWVILKGRCPFRKNAAMSTSAKIPPKATFCHLFLGETYDTVEWESSAFNQMCVSVPDPYSFCFNKNYIWTCSTIRDPCLSKKDMRQCRLNGKDSLKLNEDLGAKMRPLDSRTVFIDAKFVSSLQSITSNKILETFKPSQMIALMDMPLHLSEQLKQLYEKKKATPLKNY